ncbi:chromosome partition protein Smc-like isoform X2 [Prorops nasuta]|uniref:chromosome partition protein Smc-like isoform X2 n=1 Tax=Prorops nasuta TaxID=863751 RepID=UPI0034CFA89E
MEEISKLKEKYIKVAVPEIEKLLANYTEHEELLIKKKQLTDESKIEQLMSTKVSLQQMLLSQDENLANKINDLNGEEKELNDLEIEKNKIMQEIQNLKKENQSLKCMKPSLKDDQILNMGQRKFNLYKELTRIRWNFQEEKEIKGYITNKFDYIKTFKFQPDLSKEELSDLLWEAIYLSTEKKDNKNE